MAERDILIYPDPKLKAVSVRIEPHDVTDARVQKLVEDLIDTLVGSPGVGLAAPQIGRLERLLAVDVPPDKGGHGPVVLINPIIVSSEGSRVAREGCLSVPEYTANIRRAEFVRVKGLDRNGRETTLSATGFEAVVLAHEIDHLNGILFIDRIESLTSDLFKRKLRK